MASELTLEINGRKRDILRYNYRFHREIRYNRPVDSIWGGEICVEMTSDGDTYFLEMLMAEKEVIKEINGTRKTFTVPAAVSGKIQFIKENEIFRELSFQEAYVVFYGERMSSIGPKSMSTFLVISPMKMEVNKRVMMVKRQDTGINLGWVQKVEEKPKPTPVTPYTPPILLVRTVNGETEALPNEIIEYKVTSYNLPNVSNSDRKRVKWDIEIDGKRETLNVKGETINLTIKEEWVNKELVVMPYLKTPDENVCLKTSIRGLIDVYTKSGKYLFSLQPNEKHKAQRITAHELYAKGIQWFSPSADNFLKMVVMSSKIFSYNELKHFSWDDIIVFAEKDRPMLSYRTSGAGDWKAKGKPGDGYLLVTVGSMPYWTDAIGQIPFTLNQFRNCLKTFGRYDLAEKETLRIGIKFGDGNLCGEADSSNSYDNEMIKRAIQWAKYRYVIVGTDKWNRTSIIKTTNYSPTLLKNPL